MLVRHNSTDEGILRRAVIRTEFYRVSFPHSSLRSRTYHRHLPNGPDRSHILERQLMARFGVRLLQRQLIDLSEPANLMQRLWGKTISTLRLGRRSLQRKKGNAR